MSRPCLVPRKTRSKPMPIVLPARTAGGLVELVKLLEAVSRTEAIRTAINVMVRIARETARGSRLTVTRRDGSSYEMLVPVPEDRA